MFTPEQAGINSPPSTQPPPAAAWPPLQAFDKAALALLIASGLHGGLVGLFDLDLLALLFAPSAAAVKTLQVAVGLAAVDLLVLSWQRQRHGHA